MDITELSCSAFLLSHEGEISAVNVSFSNLSLCPKDYLLLTQSVAPLSQGLATSCPLKLEAGMVFVARIASNKQGHVFTIQPLHDTSCVPYDSRYKNITSAVDELSDGLVVINKQGTVEFLNRQFYSVFPSLAQQNFIGMSVLDIGEAILRSGDIILLDSEQTVLQWLRQKIYRQQPINWEFKTLVGGYFRYRDKIADDGERIGLLTDESSYHQLNEQFELSFKQALELSQAKSQFMAMMGHEIRTPLNVIVGLIDLCLAHPDPSNRHNLKLTQKNAHYLLDLLNNVLDYTKFEDNKVSLTLHQCDIRVLCEQIVETFALQNANAQCSLTLFVDPAITSLVLCDDMRLAQILNNLIANALKFNHSPKKQISLRVTLESDDQLGDTCRLKFSVRDNGIGLSQEEQLRIFEGFMQASANTHRRYGGTGLGLSICQRICRLMGSNLEVQSEPGQGSEFWFSIRTRVDRSASGTALSQLSSPVSIVTNHECVYVNLKDYATYIGFSCVYLPLERMVQVENENTYFLIDPDEERSLSWTRIEACIAQLCGPSAFLSSSGRVQNKSYWFSACPVKPAKIIEWIKGKAYREDNLSQQIQSNQSLAHLNVLVVDDNPDNLFVLQQQFAVLGVIGKFCMLPQEAMEEFENGAFNLVISDYQMPEINGALLIKTLRSIEQKKEFTPISMIILSADKSEQCQRECLCSGVTDIKVKPLPFKSLEQLLLQQAKLNEHKGLCRNNVIKSDNTVSRLTFTDEQLVDVDTIFDFVGPLDQEQLSGFWKQTIRNLRLNKEELQKVEASGDIQKMKEIAHKIKSSAMYFGGHHLSSACIALENSVASESNNYDVILSCCVDALNSLDETINYLSKKVI